RLQHDDGAVARAFVGSARMIMVLALPFYIGLAVTAEPIVLTMMGPKWAEAAPIVQLLALAMPFMTLQVLLSPVCDAIGRPEISVRNGAAGAVILTTAYLLGAQWGATGLGWAWVIGYPVFLGVGLWRILPVIGVQASVLMRALTPPMFAALGMGGAVSLIAQALPPMAPAARLAILVASGAAIYLGWLALFARGMVGELNRTIRGRAQPA
ncbi:MAG: lipopolysaccharide biosynthesis protein, partial [Sphingomonas sp.]|nr:lipopolysaccharide biosynthesis protein [Sphingomonas sp.]